MKLFVSYPRKDKDKADQLIAVLRGGGLEIWKDTEQLRIGQDWKVELQRAITESDGVVLVLTPHWLASPYCQWEFVTAYENHKQVFPVLVSPADLPDRLSRIQYTDFTAGFDSDEKNQRLIDEILQAAGQTIDAQAVQAVDKQAVAAQIDNRIKTGDVEGGVVISGGINISGQIDTGGGDISIGSVVNQMLGSRWLMALGLLTMLLVVVVLVFIAMPGEQQDNMRYQLGMIDASATPTLTPSATLTPTSTPTPTATPTLTPTPTLIDYDVGIAIAYFAIPDDGSVDALEADTLVQQIKGRVFADLEDFGQAVDLTLGLLEPDVIGRIEGDTRVERERHARQIAQDYGAAIVLYGTVTQNAQHMLEVRPEFYVLPEIFSEALEMTGSFRLGREIEVEGPLSRIQNAMAVNRPLGARTTAITAIFSGLIYYLLEDYEQARQIFTNVTWDDAGGQEVLHVLLGNTYQKLASVDLQSGQPDAALEHVQLAEAQYEQAIDLAPTYARPYTGLASSSYSRWVADMQIDNQPDIEYLKNALDYLDLAGQAIDVSEDIGIQTKELFIRLQIDYGLWAFHAGQLGQAETDRIAAELQMVGEQIIHRYDDGGNPSVQELASETYAILGLAAYNLNACDEAIEQFAQAIEISFSTQRRMFFYGWTGDCYLAVGQTERAGQAYREALRLANSLETVAPEVIARYENALAQIPSGND